MIRNVRKTERDGNPDYFRKKSKKIRAKLSDSFEDLIHKMRTLAEQRLSPKTDVLRDVRKQFDYSDNRWRL